LPKKLLVARNWDWELNGRHGAEVVKRTGKLKN